MEAQARAPYALSGISVSEVLRTRSVAQPAPTRTLVLHRAWTAAQGPTLRPCPRRVQTARQANTLAPRPLLRAPSATPAPTRTLVLHRAWTAAQGPTLRPCPRRAQTARQANTLAPRPLLRALSATSTRAGSARAGPCHPTEPSVQPDSIAQEGRQTERPVQEARTLRMKEQLQTRRALNALQASLRPRGRLSVPSAALEPSPPPWGLAPVSSASLASFLCQRVQSRAQAAPRERQVYPAASRRRTAILTVTALLLLL